MANIKPRLCWIVYFAWSEHSYVHVHRWMCTITKIFGRSVDNCYVRDISHTLTGRVSYQFCNINYFAPLHKIRHDIRNVLHVVSGTSSQIYLNIRAASLFTGSVKLHACKSNIFLTAWKHTERLKRSIQHDRMNEMTITERYVIPPPPNHSLIHPLSTTPLLHFLPPCNLPAHSLPSYFFWHIRNYVTFCHSINWDFINKCFVIFIFHQKRSDTRLIMYDGMTEVKIYTKLQLEN